MPPVAEIPWRRFWRQVEKSSGDGCWLWTGRANALGYGRLAIGESEWYAHRLSYELHHGEIPEGMKVCHRCDTPRCVRPDHLFLGTQGDNMRDMHAKGRRTYQRKTHCKHGHEFTPENTLIHGTEGYQRCRECMNAPRRKANRVA